jgi:hypothetical protein
MSKMRPTILREIMSIAAEKLGAPLAKLPLQRRLETDNYRNFRSKEKVFLQALVKSDKSTLISPQETLLKSFCRLCLLRWLTNWNMDLWFFPCWHSISDADLAKDNLIVSSTRKWCNLTGTEQCLGEFLCSMTQPWTSHGKVTCGSSAAFCYCILHG